MKFKVVEITPTKNTEVTKNLLLLVPANEEGIAELVKESEEKGTIRIRVSAHVKEINDAIEATTTIVVRESSIIKLDTTQIVTINKN